MNNIRMKKIYPYYLCNEDKKELQNILRALFYFLNNEISFFNNLLEYNWIEGNEAYILNKNNIFDFGSYIGKLHLELYKVDSVYIPVQFYTHFPNLNVETIFMMRHTLQRVFQKKKDSFSYILSTLERIERENKFIFLPKQVIHGDLHPGNIIVDKKKKFHVIDFFDFHYDYRIIDIIWMIIYYFMWNKGHDKMIDIIDSVGIQHFLQGYRMENSLSNVELICFKDAMYVLLVYSVFSNYSLWRKKRMDKTLYDSLAKINNIFEEDKFEKWNIL